MAMPIRPTPTLVGKDAERFLREVEENLKKPLKRTSPPCLKAAIKKMREYANNNQQKHC